MHRGRKYECFLLFEEISVENYGSPQCLCCVVDEDVQVRNQGRKLAHKCPEAAQVLKIKLLVQESMLRYLEVQSKYMKSLTPR